MENEVMEGQPNVVVNSLNPGDHLSETQYYTVKRVNEKSVTLINKSGDEMNVATGIVERDMFSAEQYVEEQKVTKTELAEILKGAGDTVFTVNFNKQAKPTDVYEFLNDSTKTTGDFKKDVEAAMKGEERTLVGHQVSADYQAGRSLVFDITTEVDAQTRLRQVDHRSINWIILKNVRYSRK